MTPLCPPSSEADIHGMFQSILFLSTSLIQSSFEEPCSDQGDIDRRAIECLIPWARTLIDRPHSRCTMPRHREHAQTLALAKAFALGSPSRYASGLSLTRQLRRCVVPFVEFLPFVPHRLLLHSHAWHATTPHEKYSVLLGALSFFFLLFARSLFPCCLLIRGRWFGVGFCLWQELA